MENLISIENLTVFNTHDKVFIKKNRKILDDISFTIYKNDIFGIVGAANSGKSTLGKSIVALLDIDQGSIFYEGTDILTLSYKEIKPLRKKMQIIFQNSSMAFNPKMPVKEIIMEPMKVFKVCKKKDMINKVEELLSYLNLSENLMDRFPYELSPFERELVLIARAISLNPEFIVIDDLLVDIDITMKAKMVNIIKKLNQDKGITVLFISNNIKATLYLSNRVGIIYGGQVVEIIPSNQFFTHVIHPYSKQLVSNFLDINVDENILSNQFNRYGCSFCNECIYMNKKCKLYKPELIEIERGHFVACFYPQIEKRKPPKVEISKTN